MAKCYLGKEKLHYLGHVVSKEGIKVDPRIIEIGTKWHRPLEIGQLQYFLGLCIYFHL